MVDKWSGGNKETSRKMGQRLGTRQIRPTQAGQGFAEKIRDQALPADRDERWDMGIY